MRIMIWGAGICGNVFQQYIKRYTNHKIISVIDNNPKVCGGGIIAPSEITNYDYDKIVITNMLVPQRKAIRKQLDGLHVPTEKIMCLFEDDTLKLDVFSKVNCYDEENDVRVKWLKSFATYIHAEEISGNVAEGGVNRGDFAEYMNRRFPDRKLYLFDTFTGFDDRDLTVEREIGTKNFLSGASNGKERFVTALDIVKNRMPHLEQCEIHQGYFPDSAAGVDDKFCFVNLDMDLYQPMLAGIEFFYPRMVDNGVILLHDYFSDEFSVRKAVQKYEEKHHLLLRKFPIADECSIGIVK